MMEQTVAHRRLVYITGLRVRYSECFVSAMTIRPCRKVVMQREDVVHQTVLECLHIFLLALPSRKLTPCREQVLDGDDIVVTMAELNPPRTPPPNGFCLFWSGSRMSTFSGMSIILSSPRYINTQSEQKSMYCSSK